MHPNGQMTLNPHWCFPHTVKKLMFLLAHEALHYMLMHGTRRGHRDHKAWNVACDKVINDTLVDAKVGDMIEGGIYMRDARNYASEELYDENDSGGGNGPGGIGNDIGDATGPDGQPLDDATIKQLEAQAKIEAIQSAKAAKATGKMPASLQRIIDEMVEVKTPWHQYLERHMTALVNEGVSWQRPNRRFIHQGMYLPGVDKKPKMGTVVVGVDTSGSIGQQELNFFGGHLNRILETCHPEKVVVIYCDAAVAHVDEYTLDDFPVKLTPHGGGGTAFKPVFDHIDDNDIEPEAIVYLTDGYGDQKSFTTHHADKTVWLTTHSEDFDWGTIIKSELE